MYYWFSKSVEIETSALTLWCPATPLQFDLNVYQNYWYPVISYLTDYGSTYYKLNYVFTEYISSYYPLLSWFVEYLNIRGQNYRFDWMSLWRYIAHDLTSNIQIFEFRWVKCSSLYYYRISARISYLKQRRTKDYLIKKIQWHHQSFY